MTLTLCRELSSADWIAHSDLPWSRLVGFGPAGFEAYARLRILPDPVNPGQNENDVEVEGWRGAQLRRLLEVLATHTTTPESCYFCVWDGFASPDVARVDDAAYLADEKAIAQYERGDAHPGVAARAAAHTTLSDVAKVVVPNRAYWLFRGPLADVGTWDSAQGWPGQCGLDEAEPAFVWPDDRAWCVAKDVDPHWAGIGGSSQLITQLTNHPHFDVILADPTRGQPAYR